MSQDGEEDGQSGKRRVLPEELEVQFVQPIPDVGVEVDLLDGGGQAGYSHRASLQH